MHSTHVWASLNYWQRCAAALCACSDASYLCGVVQRVVAVRPGVSGEGLVVDGRTRGGM